MNIYEMNALKKAIKIIAKGNQSLFAKLVTEEVRKVNESAKLTSLRIPELSQQLVNSWVRSNTPCSAHYVQIISQLSEGKIQPSDLRPDVFLPEPGIVKFSEIKNSFKPKDQGGKS